MVSMGVPGGTTMGDGLGTGWVKIKPDTRGFGKELGKGIGKDVDGIGKSAGGRFKTSFGSMLTAGGGLFAAAGVGKLIGTAFSEGAEAIKIGKLTEQVIKTTGGAAKITADQVGSQSESISKKTGIDDEAIQSGANLLLTFSNVRNEAGKGNDVFNQTTAIANDMSVALGQDMKSSSIQLGKALNDPLKGMTALGRAGVSFTADQKEQVKVLMESGDILGAQKVILNEVGKEFGGAAEAAASPLDKLKVTWGNLLEEVGVRAMPIIDKMVSWLSDNLPKAIDTAKEAFSRITGVIVPVFDFFKKFPGVLIPVGAAILGVLVAALVIKAAALWANVTAWWALNSAMLVAAAPFIAVALLVAALVAGVIYAYKNFEGFRNVVDTVAEVLKSVLAVAVRFIVETIWPALLAAFRLVTTVVLPALLRVFQTVWSGIQAAINVAWAVIKVIFAAVKWYVEYILMPVFTKVLLPAIQWAWGLISSAISGAWNFIKPIFQKVIDFVRDTLVPIWDKVSSAVSNAFGKIPGYIQGALKTAGGIVGGFMDGVASIADAIGLDAIAKSLRGGAASARRWGSTVTAGGTGGQNVGKGPRQAFARGGDVPGPRVNRDIVPAMLMPGEFVMRRSAVDKFGPEFMSSLNKGDLPGFKDGGIVSAIGDKLGGALDWARKVTAGAVEDKWPKMGVPSGLLGIPPGGANKLREGVIEKIRGEAQRVEAEAAAAMTSGMEGGPGGDYTDQMKQARADVIAKFGQMVVGGYANRNIAGTNTRSDHGKWRAWDFMVGLGNVAKGNAIADFLLGNKSKYLLKYLIWNDRQNSGSGWRPYGHPGDSSRSNATLQHRDHVHASFHGAASTNMPDGAYTGTSGSLQSMAKSMLAARGWGNQWPQFDRLVQKESSWNPNAQNRTSTAYGLGQFLNMTWRPYGPKTSDPRKQLDYMMSYIRDRHGDPAGALAFHLRNNSYGTGGMVEPTMHRNSFDAGGSLSPGWNVVNNQTGADEHLVPAGRGGVNVGTIVMNDREDIDMFWRRAEFYEVAGTL